MRRLCLFFLVKSFKQIACGCVIHSLHSWYTHRHLLEPHLALRVQHLATCPSVPLACVDAQWHYEGKVTNSHTQTYTLTHSDAQALCHTTFRLWHCSSGGAVTQACAAALVRDLECRGNRQAWCHGNREAGCGCRCETDCRGNGWGRLVRASVLEQDVDTLLAASAVSQSQRCLALSIPIPNIAAILQAGKEKKAKWIRLCNNPILHTSRKF